MSISLSMHRYDSNMNVNNCFKNWRCKLMIDWFMFNDNCRNIQLYRGVMKIKILRNFNDVGKISLNFVFELHVFYIFIWCPGRLCSTICSDGGSLYFACASHIHYLFRMNLKVIFSPIFLPYLVVFRNVWRYERGRWTERQWSKETR